MLNSKSGLKPLGKPTIFKFRYQIFMEVDNKIQLIFNFMTLSNTISKHKECIKSSITAHMH